MTIYLPGMPAAAPQSSSDSRPECYDVVVVGAGLSGIGAAYWLQAKCPGKDFVILEGRDAPGGTWDLFRYPGIRSDSDMFTFGYRFKPWSHPKSISDGASILEYLRETAAEYGIDRKIRYGHQVIRTSWSDEDLCWTLEVAVCGERKQFRTRFLYMCTGYYSYTEAHRPDFTGAADFRGAIIQPQFWPEDLDYSGKRIIVVGSGATAVTLVPALARTAQHVTMVQRSPTYVMNLPNRSKLFTGLKKWLPDATAFRLTRWRNLLLGMAFYRLSRAFPNFIKGRIKADASKHLGPGWPVEKHFNPRYNPWDQRVCVVPDGDLFKALRNGKAAVVTEEIARFTPTGIQLKSGAELQADIIVLATGLKLRVLGGAEVIVNGRLVAGNEVMVYKGMMMSDVPNFAIAFGYTNASWTLKTDLTANYICRLLRYMDLKGYKAVVPRREAGVATEPFLSFQSGYIQRAGPILPKQGSRRPWRVYQNYFLDMLITRYGRIEDGVLQFYAQDGTSCT